MDSDIIENARVQKHRASDHHGGDDMEIVTGIYEIMNTVNGHRYIGSSVNIYNRWRQHKQELNKNCHHSPILQNAWNKYGEDCFEFKVIENCFFFMLISREQHYIDTLKPKYNVVLTAGSCLGNKASPETRLKMSLAKLGHKINLGHRHTQESKDKMSLARIGKKLSQEHKDNLSIAQRKRFNR